MVYNGWEIKVANTNGEGKPDSWWATATKKIGGRTVSMSALGATKEDAIRAVKVEVDNY